MFTRRHGLSSRSAAVVAAAGLGLSLLSTTAAGAAAEPTDPIDVTNAPRTGAAAPDAASKAARSPASSSTDHANGAVNRSARIADPLSVNDGTVVRTDVVQDLAAQRLRATVTLRHTTADPVVLVYFGEFSGSTCVRRAAIGGAANSAETAGQFLEGGASFGVSRSRSGAVLTLTSQASSTFRRAAYDCAYVYVTDNAGTTVRQAFYAESLVTRWTPKLSIAGGEPIKAAQKGKWVRVRLEVTNSGRAAAGNTRISASGSGLKISPRSRSLGTINARSTKYGVTFKVRVAKGAKTRNVRFTTTANGARATRTYKVGVAPKPRKYASLSGRYFWGFATTSPSDSSGWDTQVVWFLNKKWAHVGEARNGVVPKCRRTTKTCKKYSYDRKRGIARIGGVKFKVTTYGFTYRANRKDERRFYEPATFPRKGARLGTSLTNRDWSGNCLISCTSTTTNLTFDRAGRFVRSSVSIGSWPGLGSNWASFPPDQRGTYRIISKGRVELRFANRKVERARIGLLHNALNRPSATSGVVLGKKNYYFDD
ncbi:hypothetical protein [Aeromicrobium choanae]|uniref:CARDB domain-containing protein n=1 Tax=Aeromicrobium choanae TaxID=1736691 RepID=A0A1T4YZA2_9ACTN|nr:hypothetical protein [Aeromicrobium choanae]SKB07137.1 hypothetical protein SAMN06295964_1577 [Aeromicrobium choanae]